MRDAEVIADLSTPAGRAAMVAAVSTACGGALDGLVAAAGIMGNEPLVVAINYFGAIATLEGLRPLLAARHRRVGGRDQLELDDDDARAAGRARRRDPRGRRGRGARRDRERRPGCSSRTPRRSSRSARYVRHHAPTPEWIGAGIRLNAIAPGVIETPMTKNDLEFIFSIPDVFPVPIGRPGRPEEIASLLTYLLSPDAGFFCGRWCSPTAAPTRPCAPTTTRRRAREAGSASVRAGCASVAGCDDAS